MSESLDDGHRCSHGPQLAPRGYAVERADDDGVKVIIRVQNIPCACPLIMSHMMQHVAQRFALERIRVQRSVGRALTEAEEKAVRDRLPDFVTEERRRWTVSAL